MSPRGVATPDVRERLFAAAEQVLEREGPGALTSRSITTEAGCAKGLLHTHFAGLDAFVAELVLDRLARTARRAEGLPGRAGRGDVVENLVDVALALLDSAGPTVTTLALTRPGAARQFREGMEAGVPGFTAVQESIAAYLDAELRLGRLATGLDAEAVALAVVGTVHHLRMTGCDPARDARGLVRRLVDALVAAAVVPSGGGDRPGRAPHG